MFSFKSLALCLTLEVGLLLGVPIRPEDIERALKLNQNAVMVMKEEMPDTKLE